MNNIEKYKKIKTLIGNLSSEIVIKDDNIVLYCKPENYEFLEKKKQNIVEITQTQVKIVIECFPPKILVSE